MRIIKGNEDFLSVMATEVDKVDATSVDDSPMNGNVLNSHSIYLQNEKL